jgi:DNA-binding NarL/FixJ family response regulator
MLSQKSGKMNYLYAPESVPDRKHLFRRILDAIGDDNRLEMFHDLDGISARLRRFNNPEIVILLAVGKGEMSTIMTLFDLFRDAAVIIMLSDDEPETITSAMRLKPKFLGNMTDDLDTIVPTIEKLIQKRVKTAACSEWGSTIRVVKKEIK